jgi:23S rRNA pseudouridine1911/1915/1917 synthase
VQGLTGESYSRAKREVEVGHVTVGGTVVTDPGAWIEGGEPVEHRPSLPRRTAVRSPSIPLLHLDGDLVVVDKPAGLLVHPTHEGEQDTVITRTVGEIARRTGRPGRVLVVHRLDRDTSGVMVLARSHAAAQHLHQQFVRHTVQRCYRALVRGGLPAEITVERGIGRPRPGARRAALSPGHGRAAVTLVRPVEDLGPVSLVEAELHTGRTHQARIHLAHLGLLVLGDALYGDPHEDPVAVPRLALHAFLLAFVHPGTGARMEFTVPLPPDLGDVLSSLRRRRARQRTNAPKPPGGAVNPERSGSAAATRLPRPRSPRPRGASAPQPRRDSAIRRPRARRRGGA